MTSLNHTAFTILNTLLCIVISHTCGKRRMGTFSLTLRTIMTNISSFTKANTIYLVNSKMCNLEFLTLKSTRSKTQPVTGNHFKRVKSDPNAISSFYVTSRSVLSPFSFFAGFTTLDFYKHFVTVTHALQSVANFMTHYIAITGMCL